MIALFKYYMDNDPAYMQRPSSLNKKIVLFISTIGSFLTPFMASSLTIALPAIGKEFALSAVMLNWLATTYLLTATMFLLPFGKCADIYGRKKIFLYGVLVYCLSSAIAGGAVNITMLLISRILQGIGAAMIFGTGVAIISSVFPPGERGRALGINVAATYIGLSVGPFLGGYMTHLLGWRSVFLLNIPIGLLLVALVIWKLKGEWTENKKEKVDMFGALLYMISISLIMYGLSIIPRTAGALLILTGVLLFMAFLQWEQRIKNPILHVHLFRGNPAFTFSNFAALINYSATFAVSFLLSLYLQYVHHLVPEHAGLVMIAQPLIMAVLSPYAGKLSDRTEPRIVASLGMALCMTGVFFFIFLSATTPLWLIFIDLMVLGTGFALFSSPNTNAVMSSVSKQYYGIASATLATMRLTGQMVSMGISLMAFALYLGARTITPELIAPFIQSIRFIFSIFTALCFFGMFASLSRGKIHTVPRA